MDHNKLLLSTKSAGCERFNSWCFGRRSLITAFIVLVCVVGFLVNFQTHVILPGYVTSTDANTQHIDRSNQYWSSRQHPSNGLLRSPLDISAEMSLEDGHVLPFERPANSDSVTSFEITSARTTTVRLLSPRNDSTHVGDTLHFIIDAKDSWGKPRTIGGDFWLAALRSPHLGAGTTAKIVDHDNGTYSMYFVAGWAGDAMLELTLAHPSEAVHWLKTTYKYGEHRPQWDGLFQINNDTEHAEHRKCYVLYDSVWNDMCEYQPKKALKHTKFVCEKPLTSLPCESLAGVYGESNFLAEFQRLLPPEKAVLFQGKHLYQQVPIFLGFIHIMDRTDNETKLTSLRKSADETLHSEEKSKNITMSLLPPCVQDLPISTSDGFWFKGIWHSLVCNATNTFNRVDAVECLQHTNVIFTGDSTTRQWFASLAELLGVGNPGDHERAFYLQRNLAKPDINISFVFHPLSTHPKPVFVNLSEVRFEVDVLLDIPANKSTCDGKHVVVISPWAHFVMWPWDAYLEWLTHIRDAMLEVRKQCPDVRVVVKSPHAVDKVTSYKGRDFLFKEMMRAMRDVFHGTGVIFIDIWDMDYAYPSPMKLHMPNEVIDQEIALFLSFICIPPPTAMSSSPTVNAEDQSLRLQNVMVH